MPPPAYNQGIHAVIVDAARRGLPKRACAGLAGIHVRTLHKWLERGGKAAEAQEAGDECLAEDEKFVQLYRDVEVAVAKRMAELLDEIDDNEEKVGMWMRKSWLLERGWPEEFGPPATRIVHEGEVTDRKVLELAPDTAKAMHELFSKMTEPKGLPRGSS